MALDPLSNPFLNLGIQPYSVNLRSQNPTTNDPTWSATTQYFINDMAQSPLDGAMYVYTAWNPGMGGGNTSSCLVSANDPSSVGGLADGWAPCGAAVAPSPGIVSVQTTGAVTCTVAGAAGAFVTDPSLSFTVPGGALGVPSLWLCSFRYSASLTGGAAFSAAEWIQWSFVASGTGALYHTVDHVLGEGALSSGSTVSVVINLPGDGTTITLSGDQSATTAVLLISAPVMTWIRVS